MCNWLYDVATQAIAGVFSGALVGGVLLYSQHRMEKRLDEERRQLESRRELLSAALQMYQVISRTFAGTGSAERVAAGWEQAHRAGADWAAIEAIREFPDDTVRASRAARDTMYQDLLAIMAMSPAGGGHEPSEEQRARWLAMGNRRPFEPLEALIEACKRKAPLN